MNYLFTSDRGWSAPRWLGARQLGRSAPTRGSFIGAKSSGGARPSVASGGATAPWQRSGSSSGTSGGAALARLMLALGSTGSRMGGGNSGFLTEMRLS